MPNTRFKIGVVTIHYGCNYGSSAQAYALQKYLTETYDNIDVVLVNYIPPRYNRRNRYFKKNGPALLSIAKNAIRFPLVFFNNRKFELFQRKHLNISIKMYSFEAVEEFCKDFDAMITGSDQIWNIHYNNGFDRVYYLDFFKKKKIAYAASSGDTIFNESEKKTFKNMILKFDYISVRERELMDFFKSNFGIDTTHVVDPVFLLDKKRWFNLEKRPANYCPKPFLLIYCLDGDEKTLIPIANEIALMKGLNTVIMSYGHFWNTIKGVNFNIKNCSVESFLWLIHNSEFVVTNSFHGLSFSILFEKQFIAVPREKYNDRLTSLLRLFELETREYKKGNLSNVLIDIDYSRIKETKNRLIKESKAFIDSFIEGVRFD